MTQRVYMCVYVITLLIVHNKPESLNRVTYIGPNWRNKSFKCSGYCCLTLRKRLPPLPAITPIYTKSKTFSIQGE